MMMMLRAASRLGKAVLCSRAQSFHSLVQAEKAVVHCSSSANEFLDKNTIANIVAKVAPSVVQVHVPGGYLGHVGAAVGSGMLIDAKAGLILTCSHVVLNSKLAHPKLQDLQSNIVEIVFSNRKSFFGRLARANRYLDLALVKIDLKNEAPGAYCPVQFGSSNDVRPGDLALAFGSPLSLHRTVSFGIVSCVDRRFNEAENGNACFQTDCAINLGGSGGPLVDMQGKVIGVNYQVSFDNVSGCVEQGFAFTIKSNDAVSFIEKYKEEDDEEVEEPKEDEVK